VAGQLQVPRWYVGLNSSRKIQLSAGKTKPEMCPIRNTFGTGRNNFYEKEEVLAYRQLAGIWVNLCHIIKSWDIIKRDGMLNLPRPLS
jgi:hypothetical protein